jgi:poly(3-hydroxybutyrate) depolymerase
MAATLAGSFALQALGLPNAFVLGSLAVAIPLTALTIDLSAMPSVASNAGQLLLGCALGSRLAAIAPVSGLRFSAPCTGSPVPVLTFHGLADPQNPYDGHASGRGAEWEESVPDALAGWARRNSCKGDVVLDDPPGPLSTMRYAGCSEGAEVRMIRIDGLGHRWTREEVDTTAVMWQFFKSHRRESAYDPSHSAR